ncbi:hypothetical protein ACHWQZ_G009865 [Mnemiopsis leidyi]
MLSRKVYSRINKQYGELKGRKLAAFNNIPSHCKEKFSISGGLITLGVKVTAHGASFQPVLSPVLPEQTSQSQLALIHKEMMQELVGVKRKVAMLENNARMNDVTDIMLLNEKADSSEAQTNIVSGH